MGHGHSAFCVTPSPVIPLEILLHIEDLDNFFLNYSLLYYLQETNK